ncbi:hypothetical protein ANCCEY_04296 [Ancylostoma ceylanicum]|uniref:Uncharacterized protein n=1 Tax=Ancylostoma ceylanicum TaxID=53326 RepID=A0A0D6M9Q4_9BILA|nr:hypothetical protein ANCCEY_04296 [Ancylostoma ceylanicum]
MSATLSTLSSGMNSMAAAIYEDFLKLPLDGRITDHQATLLNKAIVVTGGILATALAFSAEALGGILRMDRGFVESRKATTSFSKTIT